MENKTSQFPTEILNEPIDLFGIKLENTSRVLPFMVEKIQGGLVGCDRIVMINVETIEFAIKHAYYRELLQSSVNFVDSVGVQLAIKVLYGVWVPRIPGPELVDLLMDISKNSGVGLYLLGGKPGVAKRAALNVSSSLKCSVLGYQDGFFCVEKTNDVLRSVGQSGARIIFIGMGVPKQDIVGSALAKRLGAGVIVGVGGVLDILAGEAIRCPSVLRRVGLEWLFRLLRQPKRCTRQWVLVVFIFRVLLMKVKKSMGVFASRVGA